MTTDPLPRPRSLIAAARQGKQVRAMDGTKVEPEPTPPPAPTPCPKCANRAAHDRREQAERQAAAERRKAKREKRKHKGAGPLPPKRRLPGGSFFQAVYNSQAEQWEGMFIIPGMETLTATASGLRRLLGELDRAYALKTQENTQES